MKMKIEFRNDFQQNYAEFIYAFEFDEDNEIKRNNGNATSSL